VGAEPKVPTVIKFRMEIVSASVLRQAQDERAFPALVS